MLFHLKLTTARLTQYVFGVCLQKEMNKNQDDMIKEWIL